MNTTGNTGQPWSVEMGKAGPVYQLTPNLLPHVEDMRPHRLKFGDTPDQIENSCRICGGRDHITDRCEGGRKWESENPSSQSSKGEEAIEQSCSNCTRDPPGMCCCAWCGQPGHISSQCTTRHDSNAMQKRFPKRERQKKLQVVQYQCWKCGQLHSFKEYCQNVKYPPAQPGECKAYGRVDGYHNRGCTYREIKE